MMRKLERLNNFKKDKLNVFVLSQISGGAIFPTGGLTLVNENCSEYESEWELRDFSKDAQNTQGRRSYDGKFYSDDWYEC